MVLVSVSSEEKLNKRYVRGTVFSSRFFSVNTDVFEVIKSIADKCDG